MPKAFVDTNVLVYAAEEARELPARTRIARELLLERDLFLSVQVLNEFIANARNPKKLNLNREQESDWVARWLEFPVLPLTIDTFFHAVQFHLRYGLSHWDSLILASAHDSGCEVLYSEDMSDEQTYGSVRVINPFRND